ncbi:MAG: hypothetical protein U0514_02040 [Candidatus Andersenbacteria bacterium]
MDDAWKKDLCRLNELPRFSGFDKLQAVLDEHGVAVAGQTPYGAELRLRAVVVAESSAVTFISGPDCHLIMVVPGPSGPVFLENMRDWITWCGGPEPLDELMRCTFSMSFPGGGAFIFTPVPRDKPRPGGGPVCWSKSATQFFQSLTTYRGALTFLTAELDPRAVRLAVEQVGPDRQVDAHIFAGKHAH